MSNLLNQTKKKKLFSFGLGLGLTVLTSVFFVMSCTDNAKAKPSMVFKDAPKAGVVAKIGDEEYTLEKLIGEDKLDFFELQKREFDLKMDRINKLMVDKLIGDEAKKANMSLDDYINKKVITGKMDITEKEFNKFVEEKHIPTAQINPQIKERINSYLQSMKKQDQVSAYLAKLTKGKPTEIYFKKPKLQMNVEVGDAPVFGKTGSPVTIIEFSDFECPYCSKGAETVTQIKKKYGNKVRFAFKHYPLPMHPHAKGAAEASMCVNEQGGDKFWKFHDIAFKNQGKLEKADLEKYAKDAGAEVKKYNECLDGKKYQAFIQKDAEMAEKIGVKSTPTFFVNGQILNGALPIEQFSEMIDEELAAK